MHIKDLKSYLEDGEGSIVYNKLEGKRLQVYNLERNTVMFHEVGDINKRAGAVNYPLDTKYYKLIKK